MSDSFPPRKTPLDGADVDSAADFEDAQFENAVSPESDPLFLIDRYLGGDLSDEVADALESWLDEDAVLEALVDGVRSRDAVWAVCAAGLEPVDVRPIRSVQDSLATSATNTPTKNAHSGKRPLSKLARWNAGLAALACCGLLALFVSSFNDERSTVADTAQTDTTSTSVAPTFGNDLDPIWLELTNVATADRAASDDVVWEGETLADSFSEGERWPDETGPANTDELDVDDATVPDWMFAAIELNDIESGTGFVPASEESTL